MRIHRELAPTSARAAIGGPLVSACAALFLAACVAAPAASPTPVASSSPSTPAPSASAPVLPAPTPAATLTATPRPSPAATSRPTAAARLGTVVGIALAGPTCPVARFPPDPACADRPVPDVVIVVTDAVGATVTTVATGTDGRYALSLPPGTYTLTPQPREGLMRTAGPAMVTVEAGATVTADFAYDTGIR